MSFPLIATLFMAFLMFILKFTFKDANIVIGIQTFFILAGAGILTYFIVIYLLDRYTDYGIRLLIKENLR